MISAQRYPASQGLSGNAFALYLEVRNPPAIWEGDNTQSVATSPNFLHEFHLFRSRGFDMYLA